MPILNPDPLGIQPTILPQSPGDLEQARIKRALDLAQLKNLQDATPLELRKIALTQAGLDQQVRGQDIQQREGDIQLRGQDLGQEASQRADVTARRGQDLEATSRSDANATARRGQDFQTTENQQRIAGALLSEAFTNPAANLGKFGVIARGAGLDNVAAGFEAGHQFEVAHKTAQATKELSVLDAAGRDAKIKDLLADPSGIGQDVYKSIKLTAPQYLGDVAGGTNETAGIVAPTETPGYGAGQAVAGAIEATPRVTKNLGIGFHNAVAVPTGNFIRGAFGARPLKRVPYIAPDGTWNP